MVRKRKNTQKEQKPWCFYCDRVFGDETSLLVHQKEKHWKCLQCKKKLHSAKALAVHSWQVHKVELLEVPYSKPGRGSLEFEIFGMAGVPEGIGPSSASVATIEEGRESKLARLEGTADGVPTASNPSSSAPSAQLHVLGSYTEHVPVESATPDGGNHLTAAFGQYPYPQRPLMAPMYGVPPPGFSMPPPGYRMPPLGYGLPEYYAPSYGGLPGMRMNSGPMRPGMQLPPTGVTSQLFPIGVPAPSAVAQHTTQTGIPRMSAAAAAIPGISIQTAPTSAPTLIGRDTSAQISVNTGQVEAASTAGRPPGISH